MKDIQENFKKYYTSLPIMVKPQLEINNLKAQKSILYEGEAVFIQNLKGQDNVYKTQIIIAHNWFDGSNAEFIIRNPTSELVNVIDKCNNFTIPDGGFDSKGFLITQHIIGEENLIKGIVQNPIIRHFYNVEDINEDTVYFHVFNFRKVIGKHARTHAEHKGGNSIRLTFSGKEFDIELYTTLLSENEWAGVKDNNYGLTYTGVLKRKDSFKLSKSTVFSIFNRLGQFLSFLNGSYCFPRGLVVRNIKDEDLWIDYTKYMTDQYPKCASWIPQIFNDEIDNIWSKFYKLTKDEYEIVERIVDWYIQANVRKTGVESAFISVQIAFEILFNYIVDIKKIAHAEKEDKDKASSKIRFLLNYIGLNEGIPSKYLNDFKEFLSENPDYNDFAYLFTDLRNSLTHADPYRKQALKKLNKRHLEAVLNIGLCYLELLILRILDYNGNYANRLSQNEWRPENEDVVPWLNNHR